MIIDGDVYSLSQLIERGLERWIGNSDSQWRLQIANNYPKKLSARMPKKDLIP